MSCAERHGIKQPFQNVDVDGYLNVALPTEILNIRSSLGFSSPKNTLSMKAA